MVVKIIQLLIVFLIATEGVFSAFGQIGSIGIVRILELFIFLILLKNVLSDINKLPILRDYLYLLLLLIVFLFIKIYYIMFFEGYIDLDSLKHLFRIPYFFIVPYLIFYITKSSYKYLGLILIIQVAIFSVGFFQFSLTPLTEHAQSLKVDYFSFNTTVEKAEFEEDSNFFHRISSLYGYSIPFTYALVSGAILATYLYKITDKRYYFYAFLFIYIISLMTLTRSLVGSVSLLFIYIVFSGKGISKYYILLLLTITISFVLTINFDFEVFERLLEKESTSGRFALLLTGLYTVLTYPFGVSPDNILNAKEYMFIELGHPDILRVSVHNGFINLLYYYTSLSFFLLIYSVIYGFKKYINKFNNRMKFFFIIILVAYSINSFFHNNIIFIKDFNGLIILSLIFYEFYKLTKIKNSKI